MGAGVLVDQEQVLAVMRLQQLQQLQLQAHAQAQLQQQTDWVTAAAMKGLSDASASAMQGAGSTVRGGKPVPVQVPGAAGLHGCSMSVPAGGIGSSSSSSRGDVGQLQQHLMAPLSAPPEQLMSSNSGRERDREGAAALVRSSSASAASRELGRSASAASAAAAAAAAEEAAEQLAICSSAPE
jgi:hypothetical protein